MNVGTSSLYFYSENPNIKVSDPISPDYTYQKWSENLMKKKDAGS